MRSDKKMKLSVKKTFANTWFMTRLIFQASPLYGIMLIFEKIRHNGLIFVEHTLGIGFVLEAAEFGKPFREVLYFMLFLFYSPGVFWVVFCCFQLRGGRDLYAKDRKEAEIPVV